MKLLSFFTLFACLVALSNAAPIPSGSGEASGSGSGKGKGRAQPERHDSSDDELNRLKEIEASGSGWSTPQNKGIVIHSPAASPPASGSTSPHSGSSPPSTPGTPVTPLGPSTHVPLPGRSGVHHDPHTGITTAYYGDDKLPEHMGHLQRNQALHPTNKEPMGLASDAQHKQNRKDALRNVVSGGNYRNTDWPAVRDEKHIAMLDNPHHSTTTTVEKLPAHESSREGALTGRLKAEMLAHGSKGQLRDNPGWLTPSSHQHIAHEAPARLNSETRRKGAPAWVAPDPNAKAKVTGTSRSKKDPEVAAAEAKKKEEGYTPVVGGKTLRHRKGVEPPPPPVKKAPKTQKDHTNLVPGRVAAPGQLWHPNSHAPQPPPLSEAFSNSRHPPRPQNEAHLLQQKLESHAATQAALQHPHPHVNSHPGPAPAHPPADPARFAANLHRFNADHPAHPVAHGTHPHEAPARLQPHRDGHAAVPHAAATQHNAAHPAAPAPHHNAPSTSHQANLPHHPAPPHQASSGGNKGANTKGGKDGKRKK